MERASAGLQAALSALVPAGKTPFRKVGTPKISGTAKVGKTLKASTGSWSPKPQSFEWQWYRNGTQIPGATEAKYKLTPADRNAKISVRARGIRQGYAQTWSHRSKATKKVAYGSLSPNTPTITNDTTGQKPAKHRPKFGDVLRAKAGAWGPAGVELTYRWYRSGKAIAGATSDTYRLQAGDLGKTIKAKVTGRLAGYAAATRTSKSTKKVAALLISAVKPMVSNTTTAADPSAVAPRVGSVLTLAAGPWSPQEVTLRYQWYRSGKVIKNATDLSYMLTSADRGKTITVKVTGSMPGHRTASAISKPTRKVVG